MKVVKRALSILDLFEGKNNELSLDELVEASGINKYTVRRIVATLVDCGYLKQPKKKGKYSIGVKFLDFSGVFKMNSIMVPIADPYLRDLNQKVNESAQMAVWDGVQVFLCEAYVTPHPLKVVPMEGTRLVLHATSLGKALIAQWSEEDLTKYFSNKLERCTPNTITDFNKLKKELAVIREEEVAFDDEECYIGVRGVAAPLKNSQGSPVGSISIFGPATRLTREKMMESAPLVKKCALSISRELGYRVVRSKTPKDRSKSAVTKKTRSSSRHAV